MNDAEVHKFPNLLQPISGIYDQTIRQTLLKGISHFEDVRVVHHGEIISDRCRQIVFHRL